MKNQWSQGAFYYYCFKTFKTQNFTIKLSNHPLKVNQIKQLPVGTILSFYYFGKTVHLRFCSSSPSSVLFELQILSSPSRWERISWWSSYFAESCHLLFFQFLFWGSCQKPVCFFSRSPEACLEWRFQTAIFHKESAFSCLWSLLWLPSTDGAWDTLEGWFCQKQQGNTTLVCDQHWVDQSLLPYERSILSWTSEASCDGHLGPPVWLLV